MKSSHTINLPNSFQIPESQNGQSSTNELISWLQTYTHSKNSTPAALNNPSVLSQQLQTLTESYKSAQESLLMMQKQLYLESILNEKLRSVIQILKYIVNENLDDSTILSYIGSLEEELGGEEDKKFQIREELRQIKAMMDRRIKSKSKSNSLKNGTIQELKKQVYKLNQVRKELMEDLDTSLNERNNIETELNVISKKVTQFSQENKNLTQLKAQLQKNNEQLVNELSQMKKTSTFQKEQLQSLKNQHHRIRQILQLELKQMTKIQIQDLLGEMTSKLNKYRKSCRDLAEKCSLQSRYQQLVGVMKVHSDEEGCRLIEQFEKGGQECLLRQLQALYMLNKLKMKDLEGCQKQMWRLRVRALKQDETWASSKNKSLISANKENMSQNTTKCPNQLKFISQFNMH